MIVVHNLAYSRAVRVLWLLEELGVPYETRHYERTADYMAPDALKAVHPLGKAPVIEDGALVLGESAAILRHIHARHGQGKFAPEPGTDEAARHDEWLDYAEGTFVRAVVPGFWARRRGERADDAARAGLDRHLGYMEGALSERRYLTGDALTLADIQMSYLLAMAEYGFRGLDDWPGVAAYWARLQQEPGLRAAVAAGGPIMPPD